MKDYVGFLFLKKKKKKKKPKILLPKRHILEQ